MAGLLAFHAPRPGAVSVQLLQHIARKLERQDLLALGVAWHNEKGFDQRLRSGANAHQFQDLRFLKQALRGLAHLELMPGVRAGQRIPLQPKAFPGFMLAVVGELPQEWLVSTLKSEDALGKLESPYQPVDAMGALIQHRLKDGDLPQALHDAAQHVPGRAWFTVACIGPDSVCLWTRYRPLWVYEMDGVTYYGTRQFYHHAEKLEAGEVHARA